MAAGVGSGARMHFRNASPRTISLVTFLFGYKKVTLHIGLINSDLSLKIGNEGLICAGLLLGEAFQIV